MNYAIMREYDVTPIEQGSDCIYRNKCQFYQYGIWCNCCVYYESFDDLSIDDD